MELSNFYRLILSVGFLSLLHAAYSAAQHRTYLRITEQEFKSLPVDIILQAIISLAVLTLSTLQLVGQLKEIRTIQNKSWETLLNLASFYTFNHRGKSLFGQDYV